MHPEEEKVLIIILINATRDDAVSLAPPPPGYRCDESCPSHGATALTYMRCLDVMYEVSQVGELDPALVELAHVQQEDGHPLMLLFRVVYMY